MNPRAENLFVFLIRFTYTYTLSYRKHSFDDGPACIQTGIAIQYKPIVRAQLYCWAFDLIPLRAFLISPEHN